MQMKPARRTTARRTVDRPAPLSLSQRVERLEKELLFKPAGNQQPKFVNLGANAKATSADHVAVLQTATGLIWTAGPLRSGQEMNHEEAMKAAADLDLLGKKDWRAPSIQELLSIIDYERWNPAVDPKHFKGPYGWTWSATLVKGEGAPSGYARSVNLRDGYSVWDNQGYHFRALAVRASQQFRLLG
jgi:hypothetical protein